MRMSLTSPFLLVKSFISYKGQAHDHLGSAWSYFTLLHIQLMTSVKMASLPGSLSSTCHLPGMSLNSLSVDCMPPVMASHLSNSSLEELPSWAGSAIHLFSHKGHRPQSL